jgi:hypothetical protein
MGTHVTPLIYHWLILPFTAGWDPGIGGPFSTEGAAMGTDVTPLILPLANFTAYSWMGSR